MTYLQRHSYHHTTVRASNNTAAPTLRADKQPISRSVWPRHGSHLTALHTTKETARMERSQTLLASVCVQAQTHDYIEIQTDKMHIGRHILPRRQRHDHHGLRTRNVPRPSIRFERPIQGTSADEVHTRTLSRYGVEEGLCVAPVPGPTDHWLG